MSKREFTKYPYHVDSYKKHRITDEELDFLQELQKEMNTQHTWAQADPRIWVIQEPVKKYLDNIETDLRNDPDTVEILNQIADGAELYIDDVHMATPQQLYQAIQNIIKGDDLGEKYQVELIHDYRVLIHGRNDLGKIVWDASLDKIERNGMLSIVEWVMGYTIHHAELRYFVKELYLHPGIFFLTYRDGVNYLEKYESKYDKDVRLYAMSPKDLFTDCSPEIKKFNGDIENRYQINIPLDKDLLDYRSSMKAAILVIVEADNCTEEDLYQNITSTHNQYANSKKDENTRRDVDKLKTTDDYNWHSYGYIDSYPVKYRAEKSGEIYMVLSCMDGNISTVYHHPDITYRKIQNGQDGKFYDEDLKVAFYKLQSEYYYHLSKEIEFEVESEYFQKTNNERKGDVKQHAKNL